MSTTQTETIHERRARLRAMQAPKRTTIEAEPEDDWYEKGRNGQSGMSFDWDRATPLTHSAQRAWFCRVRVDLGISRSSLQKLFEGNVGGPVVVLATETGFAVMLPTAKTEHMARRCSKNGVLSNMGRALQAKGFEPGRYPLHWDEEHTALIAYKAEREG